MLSYIIQWFISIYHNIISYFHDIPKIKHIKKKTIVSITGNISSGKSTILNLLKSFGFKIYEQNLTKEILDELKVYYKVNGKNSFKIQKLFFEMYRDIWQQIKEDKSEIVFVEDIIGTYYIFTKKLYDEKLLTKDEFDELSSLYEKYKLPSVKDFDYIIYLETDNENINLKRIKDRNRDCNENEITYNLYSHYQSLNI